MKKSRIYKLLFVVSFMLNLQAITISFFHYEKNNKKILILGNYSCQDYDKEIENKFERRNDLQYIIFEEWLLCLQKTKSQFHFILEYCNEQFQLTFRQIHKLLKAGKIPPLLFLIPVLIKRTGNSYSWVENRGGIFFEFVELLSEIKQFNFNVQTYLYFIDFKRYQNCFIQDLINNTADCIAEIKQRKARLTDKTNREYIFLSKKSYELDQAFELFKSFFFAYEKDKNFINCLVEMQDSLGKLFTNYLIPLNNQLIQNAFLFSIVCDFLEHDNIVCFCSDGHRKSICQMLDFLGFTLENSKVIGSYDQIKNLDVKQFDEFDSNLMVALANLCKKDIY